MVDIRKFMQDNALRYLLVNSTNEYLVEYNTLEENSRYKLTNFSGSTGEALVTPETIYLFVDGRYHIQADLEVDHSIVKVVKLQQGQKFVDELIARIPENETLGVFSKKVSQTRLEELLKNRSLRLLTVDPFDKKVPPERKKNVALDIKYTGFSVEDKIAKITEKLQDDEAIYITDLDEVSYLFNMRNFSRNYSSKIIAKALIFKDRYELFPRDKSIDLVQILSKIKQTVYIDKSSINAFDFRLLRNYAKEIKENPVKSMKAQKTPEEIEHLKEAFARTDNALSAVRKYIEKNDNISEYDISAKLEKEFKKNGAKCLSFASIVAKDENSALAHYSKSSKDEIIQDGSLVLIDCGAYFEGGLATDITRVFVKGTPSGLHKRIYTMVLKAFLHAYNYGKVYKERPLTGYNIAQNTHKFFDGFKLDGFVFNHGLGHGIGVNVHEYPPNLSTSEMAKVPLLEGECFSIEPGLYKEGFFGVRLENSCYFANDEIHSFSNMNYEKKLIDFDLLTDQEKGWLEEFEVK